MSTDDGPPLTEEQAYELLDRIVAERGIEWFDQYFFNIRRHEERQEAKLRRQYGDVAIEHSKRFRRVASGYPNAVARTYGGDIAAAAADDDETVAARVADYERAQGRVPRDWPALGAAEHEDDDDELPEWPSSINLPAGQSAMTHAEWVEYLDPIIASLEALPYGDGRVDALVAVRAWHLDRLGDD